MNAGQTLPSAQADAGPAGAGDYALLNVANGIGGPGSRVALFNEMQWTGDYLAAGVDTLSIDLRAEANPTADLSIRLGFESFVGERYVTDAFILPQDDVWRSATFDISPSALTQVGGGLTAEEVMSNVMEMRIISAAGLDWRGDLVAANLFADNITAVPEPTIGFGALLGLLACIRRRRA
ncbi:MAG: hypothetical protein AAGF97_19285 [Planctomycetota bacterium]